MAKIIGENNPSEVEIRQEAFQKDLNAIQEKHQLMLVPVLDITASGIKPSIIVRDIKAK